MATASKYRDDFAAGENGAFHSNELSANGVKSIEFCVCGHVCQFLFLPPAPTLIHSIVLKLHVLLGIRINCSPHRRALYIQTYANSPYNTRFCYCCLGELQSCTETEARTEPRIEPSMQWTTPITRNVHCIFSQFICRAKECCENETKRTVSMCQWRCKNKRLVGKCRMGEMLTRQWSKPIENMYTSITVNCLRDG